MATGPWGHWAMGPLGHGATLLCRRASPGASPPLRSHRITGGCPSWHHAHAHSLRPIRHRVCAHAPSSMPASLQYTSAQPRAIGRTASRWRCRKRSSSAPHRHAAGALQERAPPRARAIPATLRKALLALAPSHERERGREGTRGARASATMHARVRHAHTHHPPSRVPQSATRRPRAIPPTTRRARVTRATRTARARVARRSHTSHPSDHTIARPPPPYDSQTAASIR